MHKICITQEKMRKINKEKMRYFLLVYYLLNGIPILREQFIYMYGVTLEGWQDCGPGWPGWLEGNIHSIYDHLSTFNLLPGNI
jgi:hypothetical protein